MSRQPPIPSDRSSLWKWVALACLWAVAVVFLYAGVLKLLDPRQFYLDIRSYQLLPEAFLLAAVVTIPWLEIVASLGLLVARVRAGSALIIGGLLVVFILAIASAWARGLDISCGCFGKSELTDNYLWLLGRDFLLLGALGLGIWRAPKK